MGKYIAERRLWYSRKGEGFRSRLIVGICPPVLATEGDIQAPVDGVISKCRVEFEGLSEYSFDVFGLDSMQAVNLASNVESVLKRVSATFDLFWDTGEPYFLEEE